MSSVVKNEGVEISPPFHKIYENQPVADEKFAQTPLGMVFCEIVTTGISTNCFTFKSLQSIFEHINGENNGGRCYGEATSVIIARKLYPQIAAAELIKKVDPITVLFFQALAILLPIAEKTKTSSHNNEEGFFQKYKQKEQAMIEELSGLKMLSSQKFNADVVGFETSLKKEIEALVLDEKISAIRLSFDYRSGDGHTMALLFKPECALYDAALGFYSFSSRQALFEDLLFYLDFQMNQQNFKIDDIEIETF